MRCLIPILAAVPTTSNLVHAPTVDLRHAPTEGSALKLTYDDTTEWSLVELRQSLDGEEVPGGDVTGMEVVSVRAIELVDRLVEAKGPLAVRLEREIVRADATSDLTVETPIGDLDFTVDAESELVDETVLFQWNANDEEHEVELEGGAPLDL
ncbi:MAG: hypothetical protein AAFZ65_11060, partial [Planctomycetota bacterium]